MGVSCRLTPATKHDAKSTQQGEQCIKEHQNGTVLFENSIPPQLLSNLYSATAAFWAEIICCVRLWNSSRFTTTTARIVGYEKERKEKWFMSKPTPQMMRNRMSRTLDVYCIVYWNISNHIVYSLQSSSPMKVYNFQGVQLVSNKACYFSTVHL